MRIRKRQPLFPLPSFSPLPLSDPHSPLVQLNHLPPPLSHHPLPPIPNPTHASDDSPGEPGLHHQHAKQYGLEQDGRAGAEKEDNDPRKGSISASQTLLLSPSSSTTPSTNQDGRWCEGEKAIPLKKRKGGLLERIKVEEEEAQNNNNNNNNKTKAKTRMKTKMNKKCSTKKDKDEDYEEEDEGKGKKRGRGRGRGSAVMEGSRCSRVNGRGWRCCQQTLVGYSLCEHHLGKGRLRSITSVKTNPIAPPPPSPSPSLLSISSPPYQKQTQSDGGDHQDHKEDAVVITKKRMKLGVVKARSISSLLGQTTTTQLPHNHNK